MQLLPPLKRMSGLQVVQAMVLAGVVLIVLSQVFPEPSARAIIRSAVTSPPTAAATLAPTVLSSLMLTTAAPTARPTSSEFAVPVGVDRPRMVLRSPILRRIIEEEKAVITRQWGNATQAQAKWHFDWCRTPNRSYEVNQCISFSIRNGLAYVNTHLPAHLSRDRTVLLNIKRHLASFPEKLPDVDFTVFMHDGRAEYDHLPIMAFCRFLTSHAGIPIPDFTFHSFPESVLAGEKSHSFDYLFKYLGTMPEGVSHLDHWKARIRDVFWRGDILGKRALDIVGIDAARKEPPVPINVESITWIAQHSGQMSSSARGSLTTLLDQCKHQFLVHLEGWTYSSRLKYLMLCGSPVFLAPRRFNEWWYAALDNLYIPVEPFFANFTAALRWAAEHPVESADIGRRARAMLHHILQPHMGDEYFVEVIRHLAKEGWTYKNAQLGRLLDDHLVNPAPCLVCR